MRGSRHEHAGASARAACGAEAGIVVNNNAAAVLLVLATLARDREVVVSRGELVEIGGGFRVPEIMAETGARLVEVGTTNRTRLADYERALHRRTALLLKVHASNYRMIGFVSSTSVSELATLGPPVVVDAGSGLLDETTPWLPARPDWLRDELGVRQCLEAGAALVTFSGDKLLGGPQAGVIVGRRDLVDRLQGAPARARGARRQGDARRDCNGRRARISTDDVTSIPFWRMAYHAGRRAARARRGDRPRRPEREGRRHRSGRRRRIAARPRRSRRSASRSRHPVRSGSRVGCVLDGVVARVEDGRVVCDLRSVDPVDDERLAVALRDAVC